MRGQMLWFNEAKDHGFIMTDEGERLAVAGNGFAQGGRQTSEGGGGLFRVVKGDACKKGGRAIARLRWS